jgi:hypothetical protein
MPPLQIVRGVHVGGLQFEPAAQPVEREHLLVGVKVSQQQPALAHDLEYLGRLLVERVVVCRRRLVLLVVLIQQFC